MSTYGPKFATRVYPRRRYKSDGRRIDPSEAAAPDCEITVVGNDQIRRPEPVEAIIGILDRHLGSSRTEPAARSRAS